MKHYLLSTNMNTKASTSVIVLTLFIDETRKSDIPHMPHNIHFARKGIHNALLALCFSPYQRCKIYKMLLHPMLSPKTR